MKEYDNRRRHVSSKLRVIYISSNIVRHPVTKTFTTLHPTTLHSTSLHLSTLHFLPFKPHPTTLHSTSLHLSTLHFLPLKLRPTTVHDPLIWLNPRDKEVSFPTHLHVVPRLRMSGVIPLFLCNPWSVKNKFIFMFVPCINSIKTIFYYSKLMHTIIKS